MKSPERLKSDYMVKCAKMGIDTIPEIREQLRKDITEIKVKLAEYDPLRIQLRNLQKVDEKLSALMQTDKIVSDFDDDSDEMKAIRQKVVSIIDKNDPLSNSEIQLKFQEEDPEAVGKDAKIIRAIKWLFERDIVDKSPERKVIRGPKWSQVND